MFVWWHKLQRVWIVTGVVIALGFAVYTYLGWSPRSEPSTAQLTIRCKEFARRVEGYVAAANQLAVTPSAALGTLPADQNTIDAILQRVLASTAGDAVVGIGVWCEGVRLSVTRKYSVAQRRSTDSSAGLITSSRQSDAAMIANTTDDRWYQALQRGGIRPQVVGAWRVDDSIAARVGYPFVDPQGRFSGAVVVELVVPFPQRIAPSSELAPGETLYLTTVDGVLLGHSIGTDPLAADVRHLAATAPLVRKAGVDTAAEHRAEIAVPIGTTGWVMHLTALHSAAPTPFWHWDTSAWLLLGVGGLCIGRWYCAARYGRPVPRNASEIQGNTTRIRVQFQQLQRQLYHDDLNGITNRALFTQRMSELLRCFRMQSSAPFAVFRIDLDHFDVINDSLGRLAGDQISEETARRLGNCTRSGDAVARLRSDAFILLLEGLPDEAAAKERAVHLQKALTLPIGIAGREISLTSSVGIVMNGHDYQQFDELLRDANIALRSAKALSEPRRAVFSATMRAAAIARLELETALRNVVEKLHGDEENSQFEIFYQPILSAAASRISGFEALIRWRHPERGLISPEQFIPLAEETGLITVIDHWVAREACSQALQWQRLASPSVLKVHVNFSGTHFADSDLFERLNRTLAQTGLPARCLVVEVTESSLITNLQQAAETLHALKQAGIGVCIDDFGTGYSSLAALHQFPIDTLKIDHSFVSRIGCEDANSREIVRAILFLADVMRMHVVAEGVESAEQMEHLRALGCTEMQGYYFSPAVDAAGAGALLRTSARFPLRVVEQRRVGRAG